MALNGVRTMKLKNKIGRRGFVISTPLIGIIVLVTIILFIAIPVLFLKINIVNILKIEYKYSNADMALLELLSYPDVRRDMSLYLSDLDSNEYSVSKFDKKTFENKVENTLDKLVSSGCYKLYYKTDTSSDKLIVDKTGEKIGGKTCEPRYLAKTFVLTPYGKNPVKLMLEIT